MQLVPVERKFYKLKHTAQFASYAQEIFGDCYFLPEGGSNELGIKGCGEILDLIPAPGLKKNRVIALACGTGTTLSGLILKTIESRLSNVQFCGISVLKADGYLQKEVEGMLQNSPAAEKLSRVSWKMIDGFHAGGYAKSSKELVSFLQEWEMQTTIPIEPVYTGKLFWGLKQLIQAGKFQKGSEIIAIHTGGVH